MQTDEEKQTRSEFRERRLAAISSGLTPVQLDHSPLIIAHLLPAQQYEAGLLNKVDLERFDSDLKPMVSKREHAYDAKRNDDGFVAYAGSEEPCYAYTQVFHDGKIEIVRASYYDKDSRFIDSEYEGELLLALQRGLRVQEAVGVRGAIHVTLAIIGAEGCQMRRGEGNVVTGSSPVKPADTDMKMSEFVIVNVSQQDLPQLARLMKPSLDRIARSCGLPGSINYDSGGKWKSFV
jgi:hypothetical protein